MAQNQTYLFLVFTLTGVAIGVLFDFFRILRKSIKTPNIVTYIEDILFWTLTGLLILYNIWYFNDGEIRIYMFLGIIMGVLLYMSTLSKPIIYIFSKILQAIIKILQVPFNIMAIFLQKISTILVTIFKKIAKNLQIKRGKTKLMENNILYEIKKNNRSTYEKEKIAEDSVFNSINSLDSNAN